MNTEASKFNWPEKEEQPYFAEEFEFKDWNILVKNLMRSGRWSTGSTKVIPPASWKPCSLTFEQLLDKPVVEPYHQSVTKINIQKSILSFNRYESAKGKHRGIGYDYGFYHYQRTDPPQDAPEITKVRHLYDISQSKKKSDETVEEIERQFFDKLRMTDSDQATYIAVYGSDMDGSISPRISDDITLYNLPTPLSYISKRYSYSPVGIVTPLMYYGIRDTAFTCHQEDSNLGSVSMLHKGEVKLWYSVSADESSALDNLVKYCIPDYAPQGEICNAPCRHKSLMIDPLVLHRAGFKVKRHLQRENELMFLPPSVYHFGMNTGFNISESVNFISDGWINHALTAQTCSCSGENAIPKCMEMDMYIYEMMPESYKDFVNGKMVIQHPVTNKDVVAEWSNLIDKDEDTYGLDANGITSILGAKTVGEQDYLFVQIGEIKRFMRKEEVEKLKWNGCNEPVIVDPRFFQYGEKPSIYAVDGQVKRWDGTKDSPSTIICPKCNKDLKKTIGNNNGISRHLNSCSGKELKCTYCTAEFGRNDNLIQHVKRTHTGANLPYKKPRRTQEKLFI